MTGNDTATNALQLPLGNLERTLIDEYLRARGLNREAVEALAEHQRRELLSDASTYASARLTEIESRSHFVHELHGSQDASGHPIK